MKISLQFVQHFRFIENDIVHFNFDSAIMLDLTLHDVPDTCDLKVKLHFFVSKLQLFELLFVLLYLLLLLPECVYFHFCLFHLPYLLQYEIRVIFFDDHLFFKILNFLHSRLFIFSNRLFQYLNNLLCIPLDICCILLFLCVYSQKIIINLLHNHIKLYFKLSQFLLTFLNVTIKNLLRRLNVQDSAA